MKVHPIPHASFETTVSRFIQILHQCSVSWKITPLYFFISNLYTFDKKNPSKWNFQTFEWLGENYQIPYIKFETTRQFFFNFASLFSVMRDNSSVFFSWNCTWFGEKEPIKVQNFRLTTAHVKFHQICTLIDSFSLVPIVYNVFIFDLKNYRGVIFHDTEERCKACGLENGMRNMANFHQSTWKC